MKKSELSSLVLECLKEYFSEQEVEPSGKLLENDNKLKKSELKFLVKEVVKQCIKEVASGKPQYKVVGRKTALTVPGKIQRAREIQSDPEVNEGSNHKVQTRSYSTVKDLPNDPNNVRDPEVPST